MRHSQIHNYLAIAKSLKTPSYKNVAVLANVTRQAVFQAMKTAQVDLLFEVRAQVTKENKYFLKRVRKLNCSTEKLQPKEIARLAGLPNFKRAKQVLTDAGIVFRAPTPGRGKINFDTVPSKLAQFARKLPATEHLTAKEIAKLAGLSHHKTPSTTLKRHGIPFKAGTKGSLRGVKKGVYSTGLVLFAKSLKSTEDLTAKEIAKLGGFENHKSPGTTLKRHGIPFK